MSSGVHVIIKILSGISRAMCVCGIFCTHTYARIKLRTADHMLSIWAGFLDRMASFSLSVRLSKPFTQFTASTISMGQG